MTYEIVKIETNMADDSEFVKKGQISRKDKNPKNVTSGIVVSEITVKQHKKIQTQENCKKLHFGTPFFFFFKNLASSVARYHGQLSPCTISEKN